MELRWTDAELGAIHWSFIYKSQIKKCDGYMLMLMLVVDMMMLMLKPNRTEPFVL